jgi:hypothetical protein
MNKEKGLYVAIDEKPADVMEQAKSLGWDLAPFIDAKEFLILDASAYFGGPCRGGPSPIHRRATGGYGSEQLYRSSGRFSSRY